MFNWITKAVAGTRRSATSAAAGVSGSALSLANGQGYVYTSERSYKLTGDQKYITYSDILANTGIVAAGVRYYLQVVTKAKWTVTPPKTPDGEEVPGSEEVAQFVDSVINDMKQPWSKVVRRGTMFRYFGFSIQEWVAKKRDDGRIGLLDIEARPQASIKRWDTDERGNVIGCWQDNGKGQEFYLPRAFLVHIVDDALEDTPEGLGILRHLVRYAERLRAFEELEEIAYETDLRGIPVARAPLSKLKAMVESSKLTTGAANAILRPLQDFIKNHIRSKSTGILLDSGTYTTEDDKVSPSSIREFDVELMQGSSTSQEAVARAVHRITYEMARVLGVEHLLLGSDGSGSLALGTVKLNDMYQSVEATLTELADAYTRDVVGPICTLNNIPRELWPKLTPDSVEPKDIEKITTALERMSRAGAVLLPDDPVINELRDMLGLPRQPQDQVERAVEDAALTGKERQAKVDALTGGLDPASSSQKSEMQAAKDQLSNKEMANA